MLNIDGLSDDEFEIQFREKTMDPGLFDHRAHLRLAYIHIHKYGPDQAKENLCLQIQAFDRTFGDGNKYDHNLTMAAVSIMSGLMKTTEAEDFTEFLSKNPVLLDDFKSLI